jgi:hypothetical protein
MAKGVLEGKVCRTCHQRKPLSEFDKDMAYKDNKRPLCKDCKKKKLRLYAERWSLRREALQSIPSKKRCKRCHQTKSVYEFSKNKYHKDGLLHLCKDCVKEKNKEMHQRWREQQAARTDLPSQKTCIHCDQTLPVSSFSKSINSKDGYESICNCCRKKRVESYQIRWGQDRQKKLFLRKEKTCTSCGNRLPLTSFYIVRGNKDGHSVYCKTCEKCKQEQVKQKWEQERAKQPPVLHEKTCSLCHRTLPISRFHSYRLYKDGYNAACIECEERRHKQYMQKWTMERSDAEHAPVEKTCAACKRSLPLSQFHKNNRRKDGHHSLCRDCAIERENTYVQRWISERQDQGSTDSFNLFPSFEKTCCVCHRTLPLMMFYTQTRAKDGVNSSCKECDLKRAKIYRLENLKRPKDIPSEKHCIKCDRLLPSAAFRRNNDRPDGLDTHCKDCRKKIVKEYLSSRPAVYEKMLLYRRAYSKKPDVSEKRRIRAKKYEKRPYVKEKRAAYIKEYYARPEVKERRKLYIQNYYKKKKAQSISTIIP